MRGSRRFALLSVTSVFLAFFGAGCSHAPTEADSLRKQIEPMKLFAETCPATPGPHEVKGVAWMKAKSKEASGQFPVAVDAVAPDRLKLEVLQPLGGTVAVITVDGSNYQIDVPGKPEQSRHGTRTWAGLPLNWAADLFLGKIPCPSPRDAESFKIDITPENELVAEGPTRKFVYEFEKSHGRFRPKSLHWESGKTAVDFKFDSPLKWEARSDRGEVKILWRDRDVAN